MCLSVFCRKLYKYCCFCNFFVGFGHFAENLIKINVFDREHRPGMKPSAEPAGIRVSTLRFPFPRSHSLENPSTKGCGKNSILGILFGPCKNCLKWPQMGPGAVFPTPDLANTLGDTDSYFEKLLFFLLLF